MKKTKPKPACPLCASPLRAAANSMRQLGASVVEIAESCGIAAGDVERHFSQCLLSPELQAEDSEQPIDGSDQELHRLMRDAEESYHASVLQGNQPAAVAALSTRLRVVVELGRRAQLRAEHQINGCGCDPKHPNEWCAAHSEFVQGYMDFLVAHFAQREAEIQAQREAERLQSEKWAAEFEAKKVQVTQ